MRRALYDRRCFELARAFLDGAPGAQPEHVEELAAEIQDTIESYIDAYTFALLGDVAGRTRQ